MENELTFTGVVDMILFQNKENDYCVFRVQLTKKIENRDSFICTGIFPNIRRDTDYKMKGNLVVHKRYGEQIQLTYVECIVPTSTSGIIHFFAKKNIPGFGVKTGEKLVKHFGANLFDIIKNDKGRIAMVIGEKKANKLHEEFMKISEQAAIYSYFNNIGISSNYVRRMIDKFGGNVISMFEENPYILTKIHGIGFEKADQYAKSYGVKTDDMNRLVAGAEYTSYQYELIGHSGFPRNEFLNKMAEILKVDISLCESAINNILAEQKGSLIEDMIGNTKCIFSRSLYYSEKGIARKLKELMSDDESWESFAEDKIFQAEKICNIHLADSQRSAIRKILGKPVSIITGGPGVGKTTIIRTIINIYSASGLNVALAAPTGRAAKRMSEATGHYAQTIHRLLGYGSDGSCKHNSDNPMEFDVYIIDESSMIDIRIMYALITSITKGAKVIFVGDVDQLPSVGAGQILADMIISEEICTARLTEIFRQDEDSKIVVNAHKINNGKMPDLDNDINGDFFFVEANEAQNCLAKVLKMIEKSIPNRWQADKLKDIQVLCPMKGGLIGTESMNRSLQYLLNPNIKVWYRQQEIAEKESRGKVLTSEDISFKKQYPDKIPVVQGKIRVFSIGDKVMQIRNNYEKNVFNGDVGFIEDIDMVEGTVSVVYDGNDEDSMVNYSFSEFLGEVVLAYACTIHKSQGSEYRIVVIPLMQQHWIMLKRKLLYTGVTRGKEVVILVGEKRSIRTAVRGKDDDFFRYTKLSDFLKEVVPFV